MTTPVTLSVANALAYAKTSGNPIAVVDYGIYIFLNADALAALGKQLVSIQDTSDTPPFPWSISIADVLVLAPKMTNGSGKPETFNSISDSAANIAANATQLLALGSQIVQGGIQVYDTAANVIAKASVLATLGTELTLIINDTAANVAANVSQLLAMGTQQIAAGAINVTDTAANVTANATALAKLGAELTLWVNDTAAHVVAYKVQLLAIAPQLSNGGINVTDSVSNILSNATNLTQMGVSLPVSVTPTGSLVIISNNITKLMALGNEFTGFTLSNGTSVSFLSNDGKSLTMDMADASTFYGLKLSTPIRVIDDGSNFDLNALVSMGNQLLSVQDSTAGDNPFSSAITVAQMLALAPKMTDSLGKAETFSNVTDTAANINANQAKWLPLGNAISGFTLPDGTSISLLSADGKSLTLDSADAVSFFNEKLTAPLHVIDDGSNFDLNTLATMGSQLLSLQDTTVGDNPFSSAITVAQLLALAPKMTDSLGKAETFNNISDTAANIVANATSLLALVGTQITTRSINITDSVANINANQAKWLPLGSAIGGFTLPDGTSISILASDGKSLTMDMTDASSFYSLKLSAPIRVIDDGSSFDLNALVTMGNQLLSVQDSTAGDNPFSSAITVAQLLALAPKMTDSLGKAETFSNITDSVANINANQAKWLPLGNAIGGFTLPDGTSISLLSSDGKSLTLDSADAVSFFNEKLTAPLHVIDDGSNFDLNTLATMGSQLLSLQDTTVGDNPFSSAITVAQLLALAPKMTDSAGNAETFSYITDSLANVTSNASKLLALGSQVAAGGILITDNLANIANNSTALSSLGNRLALTVTDTAANVLVKLDYLQSIAGQVNGIFLTDVTTPNLSLTAAQFSNDLAILNTISSKYTFTVSGVSAANSVSVLATVVGSQHVKTSSIAIVDTAANLGAKLDTLQAYAAKISGIGLTDGGTPSLAVSATQLANDAGILGKISGAYNLSVSGVAVANLAAVLTNSHVQSVTVSDTGSHIAAVLDSLQSGAAKISAIALTDAATPMLALTAAQLSSDAGILGKISGAYNLSVSGVSVANLASVLGNPHVVSVILSDTASNIAATLDSLQNDIAKISGIILTDGGIPTLTISSQQATNDAGILAKITSAYTLSAGGGVTVANLTSALANSHGQLVAVTDTASNIASALNSLQADAAKISGITLTDANTPTLSIAATQLTSDAVALALIGSTYKLSVSGVNTTNLSTVLSNPNVVLPVAVSDSASAVTAALDTLQTDAAKISGITLTDGGTPMLVVSAAQLVNDAAALGLIGGTYSLSVSGVTVNNLANVLSNLNVQTVALSDTASNIAAALNTLQTDAAKISGISLTDGGTPTLVVSAAQLVNDAAALGLIGGTYSLSVSGVTVNNLTNLLANNHVVMVTLSDTASNIAAALDTLQAFSGKISSIILTDGGTPTLAISSQQATNDAGILAKITSTYSLSVGGGVTVANLTSALAHSHGQLVAVADTASNIASALNTLQSNAAKVSGIFLTDSGTPTLAITALKLSNDFNILSKIAGAYNLSVSGVLTANLTAVLANKHVSYCSVSDKASNIAAALDTLQADAAKISGITLTDTRTPTLAISAAQLTNDANALGLIKGNYALSVSGVTTANLASVLARAHVASVAIADSANKVNAMLDTLQTNAAKISGITLTDSGTSTLTVSAAQLNSDYSVLTKITGNYIISVNGAVTVASLVKLSANSHVLPVAVTDTASNVIAALNTLQTNTVKITGITLTDNGNPVLTISAKQFANDMAALGKISTPYSLVINGETAANVAPDLKNSHVAMISVSDTGANVSTNLDNLQANAAQLTGITLTDKGTANLAITAAQFANDSTALAKITSQYNLAIRSETVINVAKDIQNHHVNKIALLDSAANINAKLDGLQSVLGKLSGITLTDATTPALTVTAQQVKNDLGVLNAITSPYLLSVKDSVANINKANLSGVHTNLIEIMPTSLLATLTEKRQITDLNLSMIKLDGYSINEHSFHTTGTEIDIVASDGTVAHQLFFTNTTESQLQLLGTGTAVIHVLL